MTVGVGEDLHGGSLADLEERGVASRQGSPLDGAGRPGQLADGMLNGVIERGAEGTVGAIVGLRTRCALRHAGRRVRRQDSEQAAHIRCDSALDGLRCGGDVLLGEQPLEVVLTTRPLVVLVEVDQAHARHLDPRPPDGPELHRRVQQVLRLVVLTGGLHLVEGEGPVGEAFEHVDADLDAAVSNATPFPRPGASQFPTRSRRFVLLCRASLAQLRDRGDLTGQATHVDLPGAE